MRPVAATIALIFLLAAPLANGAGVRDRTRPPPSTSVSESQASTLTLTLMEAVIRPIQVWVRIAGRMDATGSRAIAFLPATQAVNLEVGQRVRAFTMASRSQMHQGRVSSLRKMADRVEVQIDLAGDRSTEGSLTVFEIVTEPVEALSVPNVALIEEEGRQVVYVHQGTQQYAAKVVTTGLQGELYTEIRAGLAPGDAVVSIGSFFIDAETKLKSGSSAMPGMDHGAMPGMDHSSMPGMNHGPLGK